MCVCVCVCVRVTWSHLLQALFASTCSQLASAFPLGPLQEEQDKREREAEGAGARTPPYPAYPAYPAALAATPISILASARRIALPIPGDFNLEQQLYYFFSKNKFR